MCGESIFARENGRRAGNECVESLLRALITCRIIGLRRAIVFTWVHCGRAGIGGHAIPPIARDLFLGRRTLSPFGNTHCSLIGSNVLFIQVASSALLVSSAIHAIGCVIVTSGLV